ncbi:interleukin-13 receptor subunit alpha-1-like isoform X2 [Narcine bancroftii]|uniref:interleukin-13 receptor subunit alpha-1-like isoform X2 n=1 Tax=Narcine bancroftii TaxID=1343680 RepID=UPI003831CF81
MPSWAIAPPLLLSLCLPCWLAVSPLVTPQGCHNFSENLPLPSNLTVTIKGIGSFNYMWKWRPPTDLQNYTQHPFRYDSSLKYDGGKWERRKISPSLKREEIVQLNQGISFRVKALVEVGALTCRESDWVKNYIPPEEGENESAVTNFKCVYYNFEYLNCTWSFGRRTPPDTIYSFHYWQENMDRIQNCSNYIRKDGRHVGCQLRHDQFSDKYDLNSQVKGLSDVMKIKPFYHKTEMVAFVKLRPPWGIIVTRIPPGFHVTWEVPKDWKPHCLKYQVRIQSCKRNLWVLYNFTDQEANITDADKDSKNTIQVRAKYDICGSSGIWSEWSPAKYFGEDTRKAWNLGIALLIVIPVLIAAAVIIFLIKLKKLQKLILPPIPDPGKLLKDMIESSNADYSGWSV